MEGPRKLGKRRQRFTQREIARADRAAPNRTIVVRLDGSIVLLPSDGEGAERTSRDTSWDDLKRDA
jgi:hypothetical protein